MKKSLILTSVLILSACGGGSGGDAPKDVLTPEQRAAASSNANVTNMSSFIIDGGSDTTSARAANVKGAGKGIVDLGNVTFKIIPTTGVISDLKFHTNKHGKIISIEFVDAEKIMAEHPGSSVIVGEIERQGNSSFFIEHDGQLPGTSQTGDMKIKYISYAKRLKLKYSDFGVLSGDTTVIPGADPVWDAPFMGGYEIKKVSNDKMKNLVKDEDIVFTGLAKGTVIYSNELTDEAEALDGGLEDTTARLIVSAKSGGIEQKLAADFKNWAKIEAIKSQDGTNQLKVVNSYLANDDKFHVETTPAGLEDGNIDAHSMTFQTGYYGDNNKPSEGVGLVQYQRMWGDTNEHHINADFGFGGTRK